MQVDICIISYAKNEELKLITENGIKSLLASEQQIKFNIFVVESNKNVHYDYLPGVITFYTDEPFNYNRYLNIAVSKGSSKYILLANNDLTFENNWASEIISQMELRPNLLSASPFCPQTQNEGLKRVPLVYGYEVRNQIAGWAIFVQRKIFDVINELPTDCSYWYSDNDYAMTLQKYNIKHALITNSIVNHHPDNHGSTGKEILRDENLLNEYTNHQAEIFNKKWAI